MNSYVYTVNVEGPELLPLALRIGFPERDAKRFVGWARRWKWFPFLPPRRRKLTLERSGVKEIVKVRVVLDDIDCLDVRFLASPTMIAHIHEVTETFMKELGR